MTTAAVTVRRGDWTFRAPNREQFDRIWQDVVAGREYDMGELGPRPVIVDAGAHVGVASHWFARRHPRALVIALEANPETFAMLRENLAANGMGMDRVLPLHAAVSDSSDGVPFFTIPGDTWGDAAVRQDWHDRPETRELRVPSVPLSALLAEPVDLLKLDIEGLELRALAEAAGAGALGNARRIVLEFHGTSANPDNRIEDVLALLKDAGFQTAVEQDGREVPPGRIRRDDPYWLIVRALGRGAARWPRRRWLR